MGSINEHIIRDFSVGQEKAFRILYEKYAPALRYFAAKYVEEGEVIDDIVQDVFVCLWEKRVDFKTEETIKAFLYKAVKNKLNSKYTDSLLFLYFYRQRDNYGGKNDIGKTGT